MDVLFRENVTAAEWKSEDRTGYYEIPSNERRVPSLSGDINSHPILRFAGVRCLNRFEVLA